MPTHKYAASAIYDEAGLRPLLRISSSLLSTLYFQMGFDWENERYSFVIKWEIDISIDEIRKMRPFFLWASLCSRNFQNVKLRQHGVEILQFACDSDFE